MHWQSPTVTKGNGLVPPRPPERSAAFTLIELLVAIAIIGLLATLLLASLSRARDAADSVGCKSNLKQWGAALRMFIDDTGFFPQTLSSVNTPPAVGFFTSWHEQLENYVGTPGLTWAEGPAPYFVPTPRRSGIQICPSYARLWGQKPAKSIGSYGYNAQGVAYNFAIPQMVGLGGDLLSSVPNGFRPIKDHEIVAPTEMMAFADSQLSPTGSSTEDNPIGPDVIASDALNPFDEIIWWVLGGMSGTVPSIGKNTCADRLRRRHAFRWNVAYCDSHTETRKMADLFDVRRTDVLLRWNRDHAPHYDLAPKWVN
jgi:prepilin-type N-terminal cleavage/methylation domain-containing protein